MFVRHVQAALHRISSCLPMSSRETFLMIFVLRWAGICIELFFFRAKHRIHTPWWLVVLCCANILDYSLQTCSNACKLCLRHMGVFYSNLRFVDCDEQSDDPATTTCHFAHIISSFRRLRRTVRWCCYDDMTLRPHNLQRIYDAMDSRHSFAFSFCLFLWPAAGHADNSFRSTYFYPARAQIWLDWMDLCFKSDSSDHW